jgi:hypothetical protein
MSQLEHTPRPLSRLSALAQRLGLTGRNSRRIFEQASQLRLPFRYLPLPSPSIWWRSGPPLHRLPELPRDALSGPVQQDKADAHAMLIRVVEHDRQQIEALDLRRIDGLLGSEDEQDALPDLESYAAQCRAIRIISYKDFLRTLDLALPSRDQAHPLLLRQANWRGERLFWASEQHAGELACAIVYARRRGLEILLPAQIDRYQLSAEGLDNLQQRFHTLAMPVEAWSDPAFMGLLLDNRLPYSRLTLLRTPDAPEFLLLPKHNADACALGEGLRIAGASDLADGLRRLLD